ncbi:hypothetical protein CCR75_007771 [Bremia lactucae]|uniref:Uncharacterized protein n=1 Tax=Bremia lactucae TaxID=4779 RepID=A0A976IJ51_BRELC|nr:hypothetical protein CCR75_007771 [Bremia lactucae]
MLDHLLPLIYREYNFYDESNKENYGYVIRRRARPVSSEESPILRTPRRPSRRRMSDTKTEDSARGVKRRRENSDDESEVRKGVKKQVTAEKIKEPVVSSHSVKRRREASDSDSEERGAKKQKLKKQVATSEKVMKEVVNQEHEEKTAEKEVVEKQTEEDDKKTEDQENHAQKSEEKVKNIDEADSIQKLTESVTPVRMRQESKISAKKVSRKVKKLKTKSKKIIRKPVKEVKSTKPKRQPLQDITHLYVNEHSRLYERQQREESVKRLSTSVTIRFF